MLLFYHLARPIPKYKDAIDHYLYQDVVLYVATEWLNALTNSKLATVENTRPGLEPMEYIAENIFHTHVGLVQEVTDEVIKDARKIVEDEMFDWVRNNEEVDNVYYRLEDRDPSIKIYVQHNAGESECLPESPDYVSR